MKHLLNNLSEEEKSTIRGQHTGGMSVNAEKFKNLSESKLGNAKPLISEQLNDLDYDSLYNNKLYRDIMDVINDSNASREETVEILKAIIDEKEGSGWVTKDKVRKLFGSM